MGPYRLDPRRPASEELCRATAEQIELAHAMLAAGRAWPPERRAASVHGFRKATKRIRAALDLTKNAGDRRAADLVRLGFREAARALSRARDRDALAAILVQASRAVPRGRRASVLAQWKALLLPAPPPTSAGRSDRVLEEILSRVRVMRRAWNEVHLPRLTPSVLAAAVARSWDRARGRFRRNWSPHDPEWLHETRKRCQRLQHQLMLVEALRPAMLGPVRRGLAHTAECLGTARDAGLLLVRTRGIIPPAAAEIQLLRRELARMQKESLRDARKCGRRSLEKKGSEIRRLIERRSSEYAARFAEAKSNGQATRSRTT